MGTVSVLTGQCTVLILLHQWGSMSAGAPGPIAPFATQIRAVPISCGLPVRQGPVRRQLRPAAEPWHTGCVVTSHTLRSSLAPWHAHVRRPQRTQRPASSARDSLTSRWTRFPPRFNVTRTRGCQLIGAVAELVDGGLGLRGSDLLSLAKFTSQITCKN